MLKIQMLEQIVTNESVIEDQQEEEAKKRHSTSGSGEGSPFSQGFVFIWLFYEFRAMLKVWKEI